MSYSPVMLGLLYAGLGGTVLALIVATATNRWSPRVFFLLALRLAIGWHFLFEGLYKVNSYYTGPTDTNRVFTSEPYFKVAPGPLGEKMRQEFSNPDAVIAAKVKAPEAFPPEEFEKLNADEQAKKCPAEVAEQLDKVQEQAAQTFKAAAEKALKDATDAEAKAVKAANDTEARLALVPFLSTENETRIKTAAEKARTKAKADADKTRKQAQEDIAAYEAGGKALVIAAKATYARWVYGVDTRDCTVKGISGDVPLTGPQRIEHLEWLRAKARAAAERESNGLGSGTGTDSKRVAEFRMDAQKAAEELARDANAFVDDLTKALNGGKAVEATKPEPRGKTLDFITMWFLVAVGAMLMAGLFTRLACLLGTGFLVMTYLAHPPFPWYPLPPGTEGNPVFINKNVIEALALLVLMCYPTGRWLGLDALVLRPFWKYRGEAPVA